MDLCRARSLLLFALAVSMVAAGCGEGTLSSPTAPSALTESTALDLDAQSDVMASATGDEFAALDGGKRNGGSNDRNGTGKDKDKSDKGKGRIDVEDDDEDEEDDDEDDDNNRGRRGSLSGFVSAVGPDSIVLRGVTVKITPTTTIRHGNRRLTIADIEVGDHAQAKGAMSADGLTLTATEVKVQDTGRDNDDEDEAKAEGTISGLTGTCPTVTFNIGTTKVITNGMTEFEDITCATLAGALLEVEGIRQADGSIVATEVELKLAEVEGVVSGVSGTCPSVTFTVGTTTVTATDKTTFTGIACTALAGARVQVRGPRQADGSIAASSVQLD